MLTYAELLRVARSRAESEEELNEALERYAASLPEGLDYPTRSAHVSSWLWDKSGLLGPAAVVGFASLHYPNARLDPANEVDADFLQVVLGALRRSAQQQGVTLTERPVFTGISDMSWFGGSDPSEIALVNANTPVREAQIHAPPAGLPCVNLGPWGRDYHQWLERVHKPYSFEVLPKLLWDVTEALLTPARLPQ